MAEPNQPGPDSQANSAPEVVVPDFSKLGGQPATGENSRFQSTRWLGNLSQSVTLTARILLAAFVVGFLVLAGSGLYRGLSGFLLFLPTLIIFIVLLVLSIRRKAAVPAASTVNSEFMAGVTDENGRRFIKIYRFLFVTAVIDLIGLIAMFWGSGWFGSSPVTTIFMFALLALVIPLMFLAVPMNLVSFFLLIYLAFKAPNQKIRLAAALAAPTGVALLILVAALSDDISFG